MENYVDAKEAMKTLNISRATLHRMEQQGLPLLTIGKSKRYNLEEIKVWSDNRQRGITNLMVGEAYRNNEIAEAFNCSTQGGMRRSHTTNTLVIFSDHTTNHYEDKWIIDENGDNILLYTGMGKKDKGDQDINFGQNKTLNESDKNGVRVYLFESFVPGEHIFRGQVKLVSPPYQDTQDNRIVWIFPLKIVGNDFLISEDLLHEKEGQKDKEIRKMEENELFNRAKDAKGVSQRFTNSQVFERDPYVKEYVKRRANGICDLCGEPAPFQDKKGKPYLECHHVVWLSQGGEDTINNAVGLDPSCHKKMHVVDSSEDVQRLLNKIDQYRLEENK